MHSGLHLYVLWPPDGEERKKTVRRAREMVVFLKGN